MQLVEKADLAWGKLRRWIRKLILTFSLLTAEPEVLGMPIISSAGLCHPYAVDL
jgi:hypothetical protein